MQVLAGARRRRGFLRIVDGVPLWCGPGQYVHAAFHHTRQQEKVRQMAGALRQVCRRWAMGWEGDKFVLSFKSEVGGC